MIVLRRSLIFCLFFLSALVYVDAQEQAADRDLQVADIYHDAIEAYGVNPQLKNGVYYENFYYNAVGHPFLLEEGYQQGTVTYRDRHYDNVQLRYDIFSQQLLILHDGEEEVLQNYLAPEFVSDFSIGPLFFIKLDGPAGTPGFYQEVARGDGILCCYGWYKSRSENHEGNYMKYVFGDQKFRRYLVIGGEFTRYRTNRSFLRALPAEVRQEARAYIKANNIKVNHAGDDMMQELFRAISDESTGPQ